MMIRALQQTDFSAVKNLIEEVHGAQGLQAEFYWPADMVLEEWEKARGWGAFEQEQLLGVILYREAPNVREISLLATSPAAQRRGVMRELLASMINAISHGEAIWLEVHEKNLAAQKLYEKLGFRRTGRRGQYYRDRGTAYLYSYP